LQKGVSFLFLFRYAKKKKFTILYRKPLNKGKIARPCKNFRPPFLKGGAGVGRVAPQNSVFFCKLFLRLRYQKKSDCRR